MDGAVDSPKNLFPFIVVALLFGKRRPVFEGDIEVATQLLRPASLQEFKPLETG